jgi:hypothetical protein
MRRRESLSKKRSGESSPPAHGCGDDNRQAMEHNAADWGQSYVFSVGQGFQPAGSGGILPPVVVSAGNMGQDAP